MSREKHEEELDSTFIPLPKFIRFRNTGKVYKVDEETSEGVLMTQIHPDTYEPVSDEQILSTRANICESASPYPFADTKFFANLRVSKKVRETATGKVYDIENFDFNNNSVIIMDEGKRLIPISIENIYVSFVVVKEGEDVCQFCKSTNSSPEKNCFKVNDIVTHNGEPCVVVYVEDDFIWIRNVMFLSGTEKVHAKDVIPGGAYGDTATEEEKAPYRATVIVDDSTAISREQKSKVDEITKKIEGQTLRDIKKLGFPTS